MGETGGKDFVLAHPSADPDVLRVALIRGAFEFQGQKCSAASRAYVPRSVWSRMGDGFLAEVEALRMGPTTDFSNFLGAVIDDRSFARLSAAIDRANATDSLTSLPEARTTTARAGTSARPSCSAPTPTDEAFTTEYFGPILTCPRLRRHRLSPGAGADGVRGAVRPDGCDSQDRDVIAEASD